MRASLWTTAGLRRAIEQVAGAQLMGGRAHANLLANSGFWFAQRQTPGVLTTYSNTTGRTYCSDRWAITNENASVQHRRIAAGSTPEAGLAAFHYGRFIKITSTGKIIISQVVEAKNLTPYRGRTVRVQMKAKNDIGSHTLRLALLQLAASGTIDSIPATFVSSFGAASTDPTWGTNLSAITPGTANANASIVGAGLTCVLTSSWLLFGGTFLVPTDCKNLVVVIFTDNKPVAGDAFFVSEVGIYDGAAERAFAPDDFTQELARCQRHYWKTFLLDTAPASSVGSNTGELRWPALVAGANVEPAQTVAFPRAMFAAPTATVYNPNAAGAQARDQTAAADCTATTVDNLTERGFNIRATGAAGTAIGNAIAAHLTCEAEL